MELDIRNADLQFRNIGNRHISFQLGLENDGYYYFNGG